MNNDKLTIDYSELYDAWFYSPDSDSFINKLAQLYPEIKPHIADALYTYMEHLTGYTFNMGENETLTIEYVG